MKFSYISYVYISIKRCISLPNYTYYLESNDAPMAFVLIRFIVYRYKELSIDLEVPLFYIIQ